MWKLIGPHQLIISDGFTRAGYELLFAPTLRFYRRIEDTDLHVILTKLDDETVQPLYVKRIKTPHVI